MVYIKKNWDGTCSWQIAELVANVLPLSLLGEDDQRRMELLEMTKRKEEIDRKAHKQMRAVLWTGLCGLTLQVVVFFRLTFWELSWDVMEPIAFFATASGIICGYTYFMFTSRDPTYQDFMQRIYHSRQRKLFRKLNFDIKRYKELQMQCETGWKPLTKKILEDAD